MRIVLGVGGGIAAYKVASLLRLFTEAGHHVTVIPTEAATRFVGTATWEALSGNPVSNSVFDDVHQVTSTIAAQKEDVAGLIRNLRDATAQLNVTLGKAQGSLDTIDREVVKNLPEIMAKLDRTLTSLESRSIRMR